MAQFQDAALKPATATAVATSGTNAIGTVTITAPPAGVRVYVTGYTLSYSLTVATVHAPDIVSGSLVVERLQVPAAAFAPKTVEFAKPVECPAATSVVVTVPAAGASVVSTIVVRYFLA